MESTLTSFQNSLKSYLDKKNRFTELLDKLEKATKVSKLYIVEAFFALFSIYMILGHFAALVCNLVGFVYPAYASIGALETSNKEDDSRWLTYWVVFALFSCIEFFSDVIFSWFPFYWLAKICLLVWCFLPIRNNGASYIYNRIIRPWFLKNKDKISSNMERVEKAAAEIMIKSMEKDD